MPIGLGGAEGRDKVSSADQANRELLTRCRSRDRPARKAEEPCCTDGRLASAWCGSSGTGETLLRYGSDSWDNAGNLQFPGGASPLRAIAHRPRPAYRAV